MAEEQQERSIGGADVALKIAGQEVNLKNVKSLNTLATVTSLIVLICGFTIGYFLLQSHVEGTQKRDATLERRDDILADALRNIAVSNRVLACLMATPQDQREAKLPTCERIAR